MHTQRAITQLSFEVPIAHLETFDEDQDFYFTLSFLYRYKKYRTFIHQLRGREIWIDNSTNELKRPTECKHLAQLYTVFKPNLIVAPDYPDWNQETMLSKALELSNCKIPKQQIVVIVHHPDWIGHFKSYGFTNFATPYDFRYCTPSKLKRLGNYHFLGLLSIQELLTAKPPTCDTSIPLKLARINKTLNEWVKEGCPHIHTQPDFFQWRMTVQEVKLAKKNITNLRKALTADDPISYPKHYTQGRIEVLDFIQDQNLPYLPSLVLKYICRYRYKNGLEDLRKAEFYLKRLITEEGV